MSVQARRIGRFLIASFKCLLLLGRRSRQEPTFVFHHLPRCGGTSLRRSIAERKRVFSDYRIGWGTIYPLKYPISKLGSSDCLCGHFELDGYLLFQRYPEVSTNRRYKLFTFLRNPLNLAVSNFFYRIKNDQEQDLNISDYLSSHNNYLARILDVNADNFKERLDRYDFIGIVEQYEESLLGLSLLLGCEDLTLNNINGAEKTERLNVITSEDVERFKVHNSLDYLIYEYAVKKFDESLAKLLPKPEK